MFGILSRIQSGGLANSGSTSAKCKALLHSPRPLELFWRPQVLGPVPAVQRPNSEGHHFDLMTRLRMRGNITTLRIHLRYVFRGSLWSKQTTHNQARSEFLAAVFITIHVFCHVVPFQLVNSYRLQSIENEGATFRWNVVECYITCYTTPEPRIIESS